MKINAKIEILVSGAKISRDITITAGDMTRYELLSGKNKWPAMDQGSIAAPTIAGYFALKREIRNETHIEALAIKKMTVEDYLENLIDFEPETEETPPPGLD